MHNDHLIASISDEKCVHRPWVGRDCCVSAAICAGARIAPAAFGNKEATSLFPLPVAEPLGAPPGRHRCTRAASTGRQQSRRRRTGPCVAAGEPPLSAATSPLSPPSPPPLSNTSRIMPRSTNLCQISVRPCTRVQVVHHRNARLMKAASRSPQPQRLHSITEQLYWMPAAAPLQARAQSLR